MEIEEDNYNSCEIFSKLLIIHEEFISKKNSRFDYIIDACKRKLEKYLFYGGQPSMKLFQALRVLNPNYFKLNIVDINEVCADFKEFSSSLDELVKYKICTQNLKESVNIKDFWLVNSNELPKLFNLAKTFLNFPEKNFLFCFPTFLTEK